MSQVQMINFHRDVPFLMEMEGNVNGQSFTIRGEGFGNSAIGKIAGTFTLTSDVMPVAWTALAASFQYGFKLFAKTSDKLNYHQKSMHIAGGYTMDRRLRFHNDGVLTSKHTLTMEHGVVVNRVTVEGSGFRSDSPVLVADGLSELCPTTQTVVPVENGMRALVNQIYKTADGKPVNAILESFDLALNNEFIPREALVLSMHSVIQTVTGNSCYQEEKCINENNTWSEHMGDTPYRIEIDGEIEGKKFAVVGNGTGNPRNGTQRGTMNCTTGDIPIAWAALASVFQYGFKVFSKMPEGVKNFYMECLKSGGYTMSRTIEFADDGNIKAEHQVTMDGGFVVNKVKLTADGFKKDSPVFGDLQELLESHQTSIVDQDKKGVRCITKQTYLTKSGRAVLATLWSQDQHIGGVTMATEDLPPVLYSSIKVKQTVVGNTCHQEELHLGRLEKFE